MYTEKGWFRHLLLQGWIGNSPSWALQVSGPGTVPFGYGSICFKAGQPFLVHFWNQPYPSFRGVHFYLDPFKLFLPTAPLTTPAFLSFLLIGCKLLLKLMHAQLTSRHWVGVGWGC